MVFTIEGTDKQGDITLEVRVDNQFDSPGIWVKGSLHSHITRMGKPAEVCRRYREQGFSFTAATDYLHITPMDQGESDVIYLPGAELFFPGQTDLIHILCIGIQEDLKPLDGTVSDVRRLISDVATQGGISILAHPFWSGYTWDMLKEICSMGINGFEITNRACWAINGKHRSEELWHMLLDSGISIPVTGGDDAHDPLDVRVFAQTWTGVLTQEKSAQGIINAIRSGCTYASEGPEFRYIRFNPDGVISIGCSPCIACHVQSKGYGIRSVAGEGESEAYSIDLRVDGYRMQDWVSICLEDAQGRRAWSSAIPAAVTIKR